MLNIEPEHPIYRPLWVRVLIVGILAVWSVLEFTHGSPFWGTIAGWVGLFAAFELFWRYPEHRARADAREAQKAEAARASRDDV
jgi:type VI protein secretion system component VasK